MERPILQNRPRDEQRAQHDGWDQSPKGAQRQGHAEEQQEPECVSRMPDDAVGTDVAQVTPKNPAIISA
jgi:hypothetical protein